MLDLEIVLTDNSAYDDVGRLDQRVRRNVHQALSRGAQEFAREARRRAPKAFSTLTNSILATEVGEMWFRVTAGTNYAKWVEEGRKPGRMPGTAKGLMEWVRQKTGLTGKDLDRRTFLIARAIGRKGIKAQPFIAPTAAAMDSRIRALVKGATAQALIQGAA